jgi:hypothetical protein
MQAPSRPGRQFGQTEFQTAKAADERKNLSGWPL